MFEKILKAFRYSFSGLRFLAKERAFVQEIVLGMLLSVLLCLSRNALNEKMYILSAYCLVLVTEAINTCIETVVNKISLKQNFLSKKAKDIGSAAVFLTLLHLGILVVLLIRF